VLAVFRALAQPKWRPRLVLVGIVLLAALLRAWAVWQLPVDFDEPVYLQAAADYADAMRAGDLNAVIDYEGNPEHPPLVKLLYGTGLLALGEGADWQSGLWVARGISALFGVLAVWVLALISPLAGGLLAVHTLAVKYTSQAYLEALPLFASVLAVWALRRSAARRDRWLFLSAGALGAALAGKYAYAPIVFVLLYLLIWDKKRRAWDIALYFVAAVGVFWLLDPALWHDPVTRLADSLLFHTRYAQGAHVQEVGYPWHQPLFWISRSVAATWHPQVFFYLGFDELIFVAAVVGMFWEWRARRWVFVWVLTSLLALLLWPTKWPQYTLVLVPGLCLAAASAVARLAAWVRRQRETWPWLGEMLPRPERAFWVILGLVLALVVGGFAVNTIQVIQGRRGWAHLTAADTPLPSDTVYDIAPLPDGRMLLATEGGAGIWSPAPSDGAPDGWTVFTAANSGLADSRVRAVAVDGRGDLWFGTAGGLSRYDGENWQTYRGADFELDSPSVHALAVDGADVWIGTEAGAARFDGAAWTPFTAADGLADAFVLSIAVQRTADGDAVWFGTVAGASRYDVPTGEWRTFTAENSGLGVGGVADLLVDSRGRVWAATQGGGLGIWNGQTWGAFTTANSDLPLNTVQAVFETTDGDIWAATALPSAVGGILARFDGKRWHTYSPGRTGYSGAEGLAIAEDAEGRVWIGTRTAGVDVYNTEE